jgi:dephospho-CoA kinase
MMQRPMHVGLTGGIGSGKSTLGQMLQSCGAALIDADAIARSVTLAGGAAIADIRAAFGQDAIDATGAMDRARMRTLAFTNPLARAQLEAIVHPWCDTLGRSASTRCRNRRASRHRLRYSPAGGVGPLGAQARCRGGGGLQHPNTNPPRHGAQRPSACSRTSHHGTQASRPARRAAADAVVVNDGIALNTLHGAVQLARLFGL